MLEHYNFNYCLFLLLAFNNHECCFRPLLVISGSMDIHQDSTGAFQELNQVLFLNCISIIVDVVVVRIGFVSPEIHKVLSSDSVKVAPVLSFLQDNKVSSENH